MTTASTVLVLEHDETIRELLGVVLSDDGHHVRACRSADERRHVARVARAVPTILVTGRVWANARVAEQLGCRAFVPMPFDLVDLSNVVSAWAARLRADCAGARDHPRSVRPWSAGGLDRARDGLGGLDGAREMVGRARGITRREEEVAFLIAAGLTNAEIGRRLVVTPGTVANHVEHIRRKLRLRSRTQVAVWAVERGLYRSGQDLRAG